MADQNNQDLKRGLPSNFVLFLIIAIFMVLMMQNFLDIKSAKVSFSYQLEHLLNLDLIQPEDNRKTAINDNLVTFSGKFRERQTEEGKKRYKFLDLLHASQELEGEKILLTEELKTLRGRVQEVADQFLQISGMPVPSGGYVVIEDVGGNVAVTKAPGKSGVNLPQVQEELKKVAESPTEGGVAHLGRSVAQLIDRFRSSTLGIGNESMKGELREIEKSVGDVNNANVPLNQKLDVYQQAVAKLSSITAALDEMQDRARLNQLRTVRRYKEVASDYGQVISKLDENQVQLDKARQAVANVIWFYNNKEISTRTLEKQDSEEFGHWFLNATEEWKNFEKNKGGFFKAPDQPLNTVLEKKFRSEEPPPKYLSYLFPILLTFSIIVVLYALFARQMKGVGGGAMNFGKSPAKLITPGENRVTFKDVAGVDEALEELQEIVEFLKNPKKFTSLGGKIPKGVLCIGPPGTGKTLIAKAVAGEADRPFFAISGSDFVEMFVGVGASRIRDMFEQAKKNAPCIIFMDEIDAVGRHRGAGIGGGHDEREQTLNQLLVEMDGFDTNEGVILMAATNRPDVLDKALLRPGRFDRRVIIGLPDIKGRFDILKVHARKIKMDQSVDLMALAKSSPGCSGADLANMLNESALLAARKGRTAVTMQEVMEARDKVLYGKERRNLEMDQEERKRTAYHEAGHTIVGLSVEHSDPIDKVTIIPRGMSLGATMFMPDKNRVSYWKKELIDQLAVLMGGRCAEDIFVGDVSSGAKQDIESATHLARSMVCEWGMSDRLGAVAYDERSEAGQYLGASNYHQKLYSEATAESIDAEVKELLDAANKRAHEIIESNREKVELMTRLLLEYETLDSEDLKLIMAGEWSDEGKKERLKKAEELHKKPGATPPPPPIVEGGEGTQNNMVPLPGT